MLKTSTKQAKSILLLQFLTTVSIAAVALVFDWIYVWSSLAGGMIATLANGYFAWKVFAKQQETKPEQILTTYYGAEVGKVILTVMLFAAAIVLIKPLSISIFMGAYLINTMIPWFASFYVDDGSLNRRAKNGG